MVLQIAAIPWLNDGKPLIPTLQKALKLQNSKKKKKNGTRETYIDAQEVCDGSNDGLRSFSPSIWYQECIWVGKYIYISFFFFFWLWQKQSQLLLLIE